MSTPARRSCDPLTAGMSVDEAVAVLVASAPPITDATAARIREVLHGPVPAGRRVPTPAG